MDLVSIETPSENDLLEELIAGGEISKIGPTKITSISEVILTVLEKNKTENARVITKLCSTIIGVENQKSWALYSSRKIEIFEFSRQIFFIIITFKIAMLKYLNFRSKNHNL